MWERRGGEGRGGEGWGGEWKRGREVKGCTYIVNTHTHMPTSHT